MHETLRRALPLAAATALTAGALVGAGEAALAGKAPPMATANSPHCDQVGFDADYDVNLDLSTNKGKWAFLTVDIEFDAGGTLPTNHSAMTRHDMGDWLFVQGTDEDSAPQAAEVVLRTWDRRGTELQSTQRFRVCSAP